MNSRPVIRIAAAVILDGRGRMLLVRKRGTTVFMQLGGKIMPGESAVEALRREIPEELGVAVVASATRALERHGAEAANEPGHLVEAELFSVSVEGEPRAAAEIDQIVWVDPAHHEDQGMMGQFLVLGPDQVPAPMPMPDMDMGSHGGH